MLLFPFLPSFPYIPLSSLPPTSTFLQSGSYTGPAFSYPVSPEPLCPLVLSLALTEP